MFKKGGGVKESFDLIRFIVSSSILIRGCRVISDHCQMRRGDTEGRARFPLAVIRSDSDYRPNKTEMRLFGVLSILFQ
jgi:hypothetical protein